jgi:uncharacterized protein (DUF952 family)
VIYHITYKTHWALAKTSGLYEPESLTSEGFIHCCTEEQLPLIANFYFKDRDGLVVLEIDEVKLKAEVRVEGASGASDDADEDRDDDDEPATSAAISDSIEHLFPHVYGPIEVEAVVRVADLVANDEGLFEFPFKPILH